jgi:CRP/FNR family transcriptional regulator
MPLLNNSLFTRLTPVDICEDLWNRLIGDRPVKNYKKKAFLTLMGQPIDVIVLVKKGSIKAVVTADDGTDIIFEILEAPAVFGHQALFAHDIEQRYPNLIAVTDAEVVFVPVSEAEQLADEEPELLKCFYRCLIRNFALSTSLSVWSQRLNMLQKVAFALSLTSNAPRDENGFFSITHENLAGLIGMTRTNVTLSLNKLSDLGLIEKKRGQIRITDMEAFRKFSKGAIS